MGRRRKPLTLAWTGRNFITFFFHPVRRKTIRMNLGQDHGAATFRLTWLNRIFQDPIMWSDPPKECPEDVVNLWRGDVPMVEATPGIVTFEDQVFELNSETMARVLSERKALTDELGRLADENRFLKKEIIHWRGRRLRKGPCPTLSLALEAWVSGYKGRDDKHTATVHYELSRFIKWAGPETLADAMAGRERDVDKWLRSLTNRFTGRPLTAGRRQQVRRMVLKFLSDSGVDLDRTLISCPKKSEVRRDRGAIRYLDREQAAKVLSAFQDSYWRDLWRFHVSTGCRPDELATIRRECFTPSLDAVTLRPWKHLTLKSGGRTIPIPEPIRAMVRDRLKKRDFLFPQPSTGKPWRSIRWFNISYRKALHDAFEAAGIGWRPDLRVARRTFASLCIQGGIPADHVAKIMGDRTDTVLEHYGALRPERVNTAPATI